MRVRFFRFDYHLFIYFFIIFPCTTEWSDLFCEGTTANKYIIIIKLFIAYIILS